jgi:hypothetical protein
MSFDFDSSIGAYQVWLEQLASPREVWLDDPAGGRFDLGIANIEGKWTLAVRTRTGSMPLHAAPKAVRISSAGCLNRLMAQFERR